MKPPRYEKGEGEILFGTTNPAPNSSDFVTLSTSNVTTHDGYFADPWTVPASKIQFDSPNPLEMDLPLEAWAQLDSSSPYLILPSNLAETLAAAIGAIAGPYWFSHIPCERRQELPVLTLTLDNKSFSISAFEYTPEIEELIPHLGTICITTFMAANQFFPQGFGRYCIGASVLERVIFQVGF